MPTATSRTARAARILAVGIAAGLGIAMIWANAISFDLEDWRTYLAAAERVASGGPVYDWSTGAEHVYRYAPWFAYALVPFRALPPAIADATWTAFVVAGVIAAVAPLVAHRTLAGIGLALLAAGLLTRVASTGNVHPVLIAGLVLGLHTRAGPILIAAAASLKAVPILFAAVYIAERRWTALAVTLVVTAILVAPMPWLGYELTPGPSESLFGISPLLWVIAALGSILVLGWLTLRRSPYVALAAGVAAYLALPRAFLYDITLVLPGIARSADPGGSSARPQSEDALPHADSVGDMDGDDRRHGEPHRVAGPATKEHGGKQQRKVEDDAGRQDHPDRRYDEADQGGAE